ncbi:hypothetical protein KZO01_24410 [Kurthia zopfii]|nr:hypothetical protein DF281_14180 [Kurthia zopfii]GEK32132.1 hypothetical protein KZO01_24410 [Kurthia zopfii]
MYILKRIIYTLSIVLLIGLVMVNFWAESDLLFSIKIINLLMFSVLILNMYEVQGENKTLVPWIVLYIIVVVIGMIFSNLS